MTSDWAAEFEVLMKMVLDGQATPSEHARLNELMDSSPEAVEAYVQFMSLDTMLQTLLGADSLAANCETAPQDCGVPVGAASVHPRIAESGDKVSNPPVSRSPVLGFSGDLGQQGWGLIADHSVLFAVATILLAAAVMIAPSVLRPARLPPQIIDKASSPDSNPETTESQSFQAPKSPVPSAVSGPVAVLTGAQGARWSDPGKQLPVGTRIGACGELRLDAGVVALEFPIGAQAILQGPARLKIVTSKRVELACGKLTAKITRKEARGFEIVTTEGIYVDQGTEFGVEVTPGGSSKVHVFEGEVDAKFMDRQGMPAPSPSLLTENAGARIGSGEAGVVLVEEGGECFIRSMNEAGRDQHVVAYWRFEDRPVGILLPDTGANQRPVCATVDSSYNGNDLYIGMPRNRPRFSADVPASLVGQTGSQNRSCLDTSQPATSVNRLNVYTHSEFSHAAPLDIQRITPAQWTIEASVKAAKLFGKAQGFLGRDANFTDDDARAPALLTFQINARDRFVISFFDADGRFHEAVAEDHPVEAGRWYHLAATSDGRMLRLYVDVLDGRGYVQRGASQLPTSGSTALGKGRDNAEWTIGRAGNAGDPADWLRFWGWIDEVRISDIARGPKELLFVPRNER